MQMEFVFGQNGISPILLELADGTFVYLQGRIDRIDMTADGAVRIIDYKSGGKKFDPTLVYWGLQLQLLLYMAGGCCADSRIARGGLLLLQGSGSDRKNGNTHERRS